MWPRLFLSVFGAVLIVAAVGVITTGRCAFSVPGIRAAARRSRGIHALPVDLCRRECGDAALDAAHRALLLGEETHHHLVDLLRAYLVGGVHTVTLGGGCEVEIADAVELHRAAFYKVLHHRVAQRAQHGQHVGGCHGRSLGDVVTELLGCHSAAVQHTLGGPLAVSFLLSCFVIHNVWFLVNEWVRFSRTILRLGIVSKLPLLSLLRMGD